MPFTEGRDTIETISELTFGKRNKLPELLQTLYCEPGVKSFPMMSVHVWLQMQTYNT